MTLAVDMILMNRIMLFILLFLLSVLVGIIIWIFFSILKNMNVLFGTVNEIADDVNGKVKQLDGLFNSIGKAGDAVAQVNNRSVGFFAKMFSKRSKNKQKKNNVEEV